MDMPIPVQFARSWHAAPDLKVVEPARPSVAAEAVAAAIKHIPLHPEDLREIVLACAGAMQNQHGLEIQRLVDDLDDIAAACEDLQ